MRPITNQPGYTDTDLDNLLAGDQFVFAECYTIILTTGQKYYFTNAQQSVSVVPVGDPMRVNYLAGQMLIKGLRFKIGVGVEVDEQTVTLSYSPDVLIRNVTVPEAIRRGYLDGARITRDRFFAAEWGSPWIGGIPMFHGRVSTADSAGRVASKLKVKSDLVLLNINEPSTLEQPSCTHTLFDTGCKLNRASFSTIATITAGTPTSSFIPWTGALASHSLGTFHIDDGYGVTLIRTIRQAVAGVGLNLAYPLEIVPVVGDSFTAWPGCDRLLTTCQSALFNNQQNFLGFPFVPVAETAA